MNKTLRSVLLAFSLLALSTVALAGPGHDRDHDRRGYGHDRGNHHGWQQRGHGHYREAPRHVRHVDRRGHHWQRGHRYGGPIHVVRDYGHYRLRQPPRGYGWVRASNNDYLLVALATGVIMDIALR